MLKTFVEKRKYIWGITGSRNVFTTKYSCKLLKNKFCGRLFGWAVFFLIFNYIFLNETKLSYNILTK